MEEDDIMNARLDLIHVTPVAELPMPEGREARAIILCVVAQRPT